MINWKRPLIVFCAACCLLPVANANATAPTCNDQGEYHTRLVDRSQGWRIEDGPSGTTENQSSGVLLVVPWGVHYVNFDDDNRIACWHIGMHVGEEGVTFAIIHGRMQDLVSMYYLPRNQNSVQQGFDRARRGDLDIHGVEHRYVRIGFQQGKRENHYRFNHANCAVGEWRRDACSPITTPVVNHVFNRHYE